jgi:hypothetical protein
MGYVCPFVLSNFTNFKLRKDHIYNFQFPHNIAEILRKLALNTNQSINQSMCGFCPGTPVSFTNKMTIAI